VKVFASSRPNYQYEDLATALAPCLINRTECVAMLKRSTCRVGGDTVYNLVDVGGANGSSSISATIARQLGGPSWPNGAESSVAGEGTPITRDEGMAVLSAALPEIRACVVGGDAPPSITLRLQINGDGSAIFLGATPAAPAGVSRCLRELISSLRFRATGARPITVTTPPVELSPTGW
jgi:hypothetical protein